MRMFMFAAVISCFPISIWANGPQWVGTIDIDGVEMRCRPALNAESTGILKKGDTVHVVGSEGEFYSIKPPEGIVSFVHAIHLGKLEAGEKGRFNAVVSIESGTDVRAGESVRSRPLPVVTIRLPAGTIVEIVGDAVTDVQRNGTSTKWYPIIPPEGDVRWIPKTVVRKIAAVPPPPVIASKPSPETSGGKLPPASVEKTGLPSSLANHKLLPDAERAEQALDYHLALSIYNQIYEDLRKQSAESEALTIVYNRIVQSQSKIREAARPKPSTEGTLTSSNSSGKPLEGSIQKLPEPKLVTYGPGYLREVPNLYIEGVQAYKLIDDRGYVIIYAIPQRGVNLAEMTSVRDRVTLTGTIVKTPTLAAPYLSVERAKR
ncbi:MAG: hypothetical protein N2112_11130 [Gemmataceae bacterium]|nr:hypothetical protein [Gemmataceae bacterium]